MSDEAPRQAAIALLAATLIDLIAGDRPFPGRGSAVGVPNALSR